MGVNLCLCMMVGADLENLRQAVRSARQLVDCVAIVNTGDAGAVTMRMLGELSDAVGVHPWADDFSGPRNASLELAESLGADWAFVLDSDERLSYPGQAISHEPLGRQVCESVRAALGRPLTWPDCGGVVTCLDVEPGRASPEWPWRRDVRLLPVSRQVRYHGRVHHRLRGPAGPLQTLLPFPVLTVAHVGHASHRRPDKRARTLHLLQLELRERPNEALVHFYAAREYADAGMLGAAREHARQAAQLSGRDNDAELGVYVEALSALQARLAS